MNGKAGVIAASLAGPSTLTEKKASVQNWVPSPLLHSRSLRPLHLTCRDCKFSTVDFINFDERLQSTANGGRKLTTILNAAFGIVVK